MGPKTPSKANQLKSNAASRFQRQSFPKRPPAKTSGGDATRLRKDVSRPHEKPECPPAKEYGKGWSKREGCRKSGASKPRTAAFVRRAVTLGTNPHFRASPALPGCNLHVPPGSLLSLPFWNTETREQSRDHVIMQSRNLVITRSRDLMILLLA